MKRISVIMGVYRPEPAMLEAAVASVLGQTFRELEFIICDDGSGDGTLEFLRWLACRDDRLRICGHHTNKGLAAALNTCLDHTKGEYIARQDADDRSLPERFAMQADFLDRNPGHACVGSSIRLFDDNGEWAVKRFPLQPEKKDFLFAIPFLHGSLMFRGDVLRAHRYHVGRITRRTEDYELLMRLYCAGYKGYNLPEPLYLYREDKASLERRKFRYRVDEAIVRARGFYGMGLLPRGIPYICKPLAVGLIPAGLLLKMKKRYYHL